MFGTVFVEVHFTSVLMFEQSTPYNGVDFTGFLIQI